MNILVGMLILGLIVFLHELGHFLAAKALGVPAPIFSLGFGPALLRYQWRGTEYRLSALPLGGYVLFGHGESLETTGVRDRIIIFLAGPIANFLTALAIYQGFALYADTEAVQAFSQKLGVEPNAPAIVQGFAMFFAETGNVLSVVGKLVTGQIGLNQLAGPIGIMHVAGNAASSGMTDVLNFIAMLSINLGILNLLPLPVLDGGQILIAAIEGITRRTINMKVRIAVALVCWALLFFLILHVTVGDISRLGSTKAAIETVASSVNA